MAQLIDIQIKKLHENAVIPYYNFDGDSGFDLHSVQHHYIYPNQQALVKTGLAMAIPQGFEMQIRPRSGLALNQQITLTNSPGTIDSVYRGEIGVIIYNLGQYPFVVESGDRIAQGVIQPVYHAIFHEADALDETERSSGGYGHTGLKRGEK